MGLRLTMKSRPLRLAVPGALPEGRRNGFETETGSGSEESSLTVNDRRLKEFGVEDNEGCLMVVLVYASDRAVPAR
jgi:hypothetical protein